MERLHQRADIVVVSGTPGEALVREWEEHDIAGFVDVIAGQEMGSKTEHIRMAAGGKYAEGRLLMIGDAPGDMKAAHANGARFYPIVPGQEEASWEVFHSTVLDLFFEGGYSEVREAEAIREFEARLPEVPHWISKA